MSDVSNGSSLGPARPHPRPLVELLALAGPTVAQMASYTLMQFADTWMLARVGDAEAAAVGAAGMFAFSVISFGMGVLFLVNALVSQSFGRGDSAACGRYLWQGVWWSLVYSALLLPIFPLARPLFDSFGHEARVAGFEATYFRIVVGASVVKLMATALGQFLMAIDRPSAVLWAAVAGVVVNTVGDYLLIFGAFGFPEMGVAGAAWATNFAVLIELLVLAAFVLRPSVRRVYNVLDWRPRRVEMTNLLKTGVPSGVQVAAEVLSWSLFATWVVGGFYGTTGMAAYQYMLRYLITGFMPCLGISSAVTALVGRYVGMGRPDLAVHRAHLGFAAAAVYTVCCGLVFFFARERLIRLFTDDPDVVRMGMTLLSLAAVYSFFDATYIVYCGALRGAADTFVPGVVTGVLCWGIMLGGGYVIALYRPGWGVVGPWYAATVYGVLLAAFMFVRFQRGGWKGIHLEGDGASDKVRGSAVSARAAVPAE